MRIRSRHFFAVDPGERYCGFAWFVLGGFRRADHWMTTATGLPFVSSDGQLWLRQCLTFTPPDECFDYLETNLHHADHLVIERFQLYPWLARQQGFSEFGTAEAVGICKRIARRVHVPVTLQDASRNLKEGRQWADRCGFPMVERLLGSGRFQYRGPDFDLPGKPHRRDAAAHGCQFLCSSALYSPR